MHPAPGLPPLPGWPELACRAVAMTPRRRLLGALALLVVLLAGGGVAVVLIGNRQPALTPAEQAELAAAAARHRLEAAERSLSSTALRALAVSLPTKVAPEPPLPGKLFRRPLASHEVVGFVPYWTLPSLLGADYSGASVLCFYGVSTTADGAIDLSGPEWSSAGAVLASSAFADFVDRAHAAGTSVLLTVASANDQVISALVASPAPHAARLASGLEQLVRRYGLDGIDIDIEGTRASERAGFSAFAAQLSADLRRLSPSGELLLDTYAGSAANPRDFFDVSRLWHDADAIFVEGYDMQNPTHAGSTSPLSTSNLAYSESQTIIQYRALVPGSHLILGLPFYGYDYTVATLAPGARRAVATPEAVTYQAVRGVGRASYWDPVAASAFTRFHLDGALHETYYDDPLSLAAKTALAIQSHLLGVGAWAFGMEGGDPMELAALAGEAPLKRITPRH
jgi:Glycosyl hydrolases family 18